MQKWQKFSLVILVLLLFTPVFSQRDNQDQTFRWSYYVGIGKFVIHHKSLAWFDTLKRDFRIELKIVSTNNHIIYGNGRIMIPRYESGELIPASFNFSIEGYNQDLVVEIKNINVYQHDVIVSKHTKAQELKDLKFKLQYVSEILAEYIRKSEYDFSRYFSNKHFNE